MACALQGQYIHEMKKDIFAYRVVVWFNNTTSGTHQQTFGTGSTPKQAMKEFTDYLKRPVACRSFGPGSRAQLHGPDGLISELLV